MNMSKGTAMRAVSGAVLALMLFASEGAAQPPVKRRPHQAPPKSSPHLQDSKARLRPTAGLQYAANRYMLFLSDAPVAAHMAAHASLQSAEAVSYRQQIEAKQQAVMADLARQRYRGDGIGLERGERDFSLHHARPAGGTEEPFGRHRGDAGTPHRAGTR